MKSGQNSEAAKSLAQAAQELAKAVAKSENAKSLARAMQGLAMASKSIGSGQGMGRSPGGMTPGGPKSSAKSGSGDSWNPYGTPNPTGNVRPGSATAALSAGQRDAQLSAGVTPVKIKGQFSPGAPTPSITLKGVSIRGQSKVQYEESVAAAQGDAQAALSQEKIPRAYQGAVKDYFDDLKK